MADYSFLSDSDDENSAQIILSEASDSIVLEQIAAINCSGFTDSVLPSQLEARFHKLKSFPSVASKPKPVIRSHSSVSSEFKDSNKCKDDDAALNLGKSSAEKAGVASKCDLSLNIFNNSEKNPNGENTLKENLEPDFGLSTLKSSEFSLEDEYYWDSMKFRDKKGRRKRNELKSPTETSSLPSSYSSESLSPPKRSGCFWCSPKRVSRNNSRNRRSLEKSGHFGKDVKGNDLLGDLNRYLEKKQQKLMKKAMEEEQKICREAEKIVNLAKQASARIEVSSLEDELSDTGSL